MIDWRMDGGPLTAWDGDTLVARVFKDGCEWLVVGAVPPAGVKRRSEAIEHVEREWARIRSDAQSDAVGAGAGAAG